MKNTMTYAKAHAKLLPKIAVTCGLALLSVLPVYADSGSENKQYNACALDKGSPGLFTDKGWAVILNFNHTPSSNSTVACLMFVQDGDHKVKSRLLNCPIISNGKSMPNVGDGSAKFDGNFYIECDLDTTTLNLPANATYWIAANVKLPKTGTYLLANYNNEVVFTATAEKNNQWQLNSQWWSAKFSDKAKLKLDDRATLISAVSPKGGNHYVNYKPVGNYTSVTLKPVASKGKLRVGGMDQSFVMTQLIFDPSITCCDP